MKSMKSKILLILALMLSIGSFSTASALSIIEVDTSVNAEVKTQGNTISTVKTEVKGNATSSNAKTLVRGNATSSSRTEVKGNDTSAGAKLKSETHGSEVVAIVKALLEIANRDLGIGAEVRVIAQSQNDSASTTLKAVTKVEKRGVLKRIFFGSDYKNIGQLRSEMVKTQNDIEKLEKLVPRATDAEVKADLNIQINVLKATQVKLATFIKANESSFSLFGWMKKD